MWLRDTGVLDKLAFDALNPPIPIPDPKLRDKKPLILSQLGGIMILLVVGLAFAMIVYILELWLYSIRLRVEHARRFVACTRRASFPSPSGALTLPNRYFSAEYWTGKI